MRILSLFCILAALSFTAAALFTVHLGTERVWVSLPDPRLARLRAELLACTRALDGLELSMESAFPAGANAPRAADLDVVGFDELDALRGRLRTVEARLGLGPARLHSSVPKGGFGTLDPIERLFSGRHHLQRALDAELPAAERVAALRALDSLGEGALIDPELADRMLALARGPVSPQVRREIFWGLKSRPYPQVIDAALDALLFEEDVPVREECVLLLGAHAAGRVDLRRALERARDLDPSPKVRRRAALALERR